MNHEEEQALLRVLREANTLATGPEGEAFEREFTVFIGSADSVAVSSCSSALELVNRVRVPYYQLITEGFEHTAGDDVIERVACRLMGLDVGPSRRPILPCPPELAERVKWLLIEFGALDRDGKPTNR